MLCRLTQRQHSHCNYSRMELTRTTSRTRASIWHLSPSKSINSNCWRWSTAPANHLKYLSSRWCKLQASRREESSKTNWLNVSNWVCWRVSWTNVSSDYWWSRHSVEMWMSRTLPICCRSSRSGMDSLNKLRSKWVSTLRSVRSPWLDTMCMGRKWRVWLRRRRKMSNKCSRPND